jgi:hypothetical protein
MPESVANVVLVKSAMVYRYTAREEGLPGLWPVSRYVMRFGCSTQESRKAAHVWNTRLLLGVGLIVEGEKTNGGSVDAEWRHPNYPLSRGITQTNLCVALPGVLMSSLHEFINPILPLFGPFRVMLSNDLRRISEDVRHFFKGCAQPK